MLNTQVTKLIAHLKTLLDFIQRTVIIKVNFRFDWGGWCIHKRLSGNDRNRNPPFSNKTTKKEKKITNGGEKVTCSHKRQK